MSGRLAEISINLLSKMQTFKARTPKISFFPAVSGQCLGAIRQLHLRSKICQGSLLKSHLHRQKHSIHPQIENGSQAEVHSSCSTHSLIDGQVSDVLFASGGANRIRKSKSPEGDTVNTEVTIVAQTDLATEPKIGSKPAEFTHGGRNDLCQVLLKEGSPCDDSEVPLWLISSTPKKAILRSSDDSQIDLVGSRKNADNSGSHDRGKRSTSVPVTTNYGQLRYVCRLTEPRSLSSVEIMMAMPSLRALAYDRALVAAASDSLLPKVRLLADRLQKELANAPPEKQYFLTEDERTVLCESLKATRLVNCDEELKVHATQRTNVNLSGVSKSKSPHMYALAMGKAQQHIVLTSDSLCKMNSCSIVDKGTWVTIKEGLKNLMYSKDSNERAPLQILDAPPSLTNDIRDFVQNADECVRINNELNLNTTWHAKLEDLISRLNQLQLTFDERPYKCALKSLYDNCPPNEVSNAHCIRLNQRTANTVLRALEMANRRVRIDKKFTDNEDYLSEDSSTAAKELENRLHSEIIRDTVGAGTTCSVLSLKDAVLVQHVLLSTMSAHNSTRSNNEQQEDYEFFQLCSQNSGVTFDNSPISCGSGGTPEKLGEGFHSPRILSPISEKGTPETSFYDSEQTGTESSTENQRFFKPSSQKAELANSERVGQLIVPSMSGDDMRIHDTEGVRTLVVTARTSSHDNAAPREDGATAKGLLAETPYPQGQETFELEKSVIRPIATYLRSKLLNNLSKGVMTPAPASISNHYEQLSSVLDNKLLKSTDSTVSLLPAEMSLVRTFLISDNTPYARILNRSLETANASQTNSTVRNAEFRILQGTQEKQPTETVTDYPRVHRSSEGPKEQAKVATSVKFQSSESPVKLTKQEEQSEQLDQLDRLLRDKTEKELTPEEATAFSSTLLRILPSISDGLSSNLTALASDLQQNPRKFRLSSLMVSDIRKLLREVRESEGERERPPQPNQRSFLSGVKTVAILSPPSLIGECAKTNGHPEVAQLGPETKEYPVAMLPAHLFCGVVSAVGILKTLVSVYMTCKPLPELSSPVKRLLKACFLLLSKRYPFVGARMKQAFNMPLVLSEELDPANLNQNNLNWDIIQQAARQIEDSKEYQEELRRSGELIRQCTLNESSTMSDGDKMRLADAVCSKLINGISTYQVDEAVAVLQLLGRLLCKCESDQLDSSEMSLLARLVNRTSGPRDSPINQSEPDIIEMSLVECSLRECLPSEEEQTTGHTQELFQLSVMGRMLMFLHRSQTYQLRPEVKIIEPCLLGVLSSFIASRQLILSQTVLENWRRDLHGQLVAIQPILPLSHLQFELKAILASFLCDRHKTSVEDARRKVAKKILHFTRTSCTTLSPEQIMALLKVVDTVQLLCTYENGADTAYVRNVDSLINAILSRKDANKCSSVVDSCLAARELHSLLTHKVLPERANLTEFTASDSLFVAQKVGCLSGEKISSAHIDPWLLKTLVQQAQNNAVHQLPSHFIPSMLSSVGNEIEHCLLVLTKKLDQEIADVCNKITVENIHRDQLVRLVKATLLSYTFNHSISLRSWLYIRNLATLLDELQSTDQDWSAKIVEIRSLVHLLQNYTVMETKNDLDASEQVIALSQLNIVRDRISEMLSETNPLTITETYFTVFFLSQLMVRNRVKYELTDADMLTFVTVTSQLLLGVEETSLGIINPSNLPAFQNLVDKISASLYETLFTLGTSELNDLVSNETPGRADHSASVSTILLPVVISGKCSHSLIQEIRSDIRLFQSLAEKFTESCSGQSDLLDTLSDIIECLQPPSQPPEISSSSSVFELIETLDQLIPVMNTLIISDRKSAGNVLRNIVRLENLTKILKLSPTTCISVLKNNLMALIATDIDLFPFSIEQDYVDCMQQFVDQANDFIDSRSTTAINDGLKALGLKETDDEDVNMETIAQAAENLKLDRVFCLDSSQKGRLIEALSFALLRDKELSPKKARTIIELQTKLLSSLDSCSLTHTEYQLAAETLNASAASETDTTYGVANLNARLDQSQLESLHSSLISHFGTKQEFEPAEAAEVSATLATVLDNPLIDRHLSEEEQISLTATRKRLLFAAIRGRAIVPAELSELDEKANRSLIRSISEMIQTGKKEKRLSTRFSMYSPDEDNDSPTDKVTKRLDPEATQSLFDKMLIKMQKHVPRLHTMVPLISVLSELQASHISVPSEGNSQSQPVRQSIACNISLEELDMVTEFLEPIKHLKRTTPLHEYLAAFFHIQHSVDTEPLWPLEAGFLLSSIITLSDLDKTTYEFYDLHLRGLQDRLSAGTFDQENFGDPYSDTSSTLDREDLQFLHAFLDTAGEILVENIKDFLAAAPGELQTSQMSDISGEKFNIPLELFRIFLVGQANEPVSTTEDVILSNRIAAALNSDVVTTDVLELAKGLCYRPKFLRLFEEAEPSELGSGDTCQPYFPSHHVIFLSTILEQLVEDSDMNEELTPTSSLLLAQVLHALESFDAQAEGHRLMPRWSSHLSRLTWCLQLNSFLGRSLRFDVRNRALLSIACKHYKDMVALMLHNTAESALQMVKPDTESIELGPDARLGVVDLLFVVLTCPAKYGLSPIRAGQVAELIDLLQFNCMESNIAMNDLTLLQEIFIDIVGAEDVEYSCSNDTTTLFSCVELVEQIIHKLETNKLNWSSLSRKELAILGTTLNILLNFPYRQPQFCSWDSEENPNLSTECRPTLTMTLCLLNSLVTSADFEMVSRASKLSATELESIKELVEFSKPRIQLEAQKQRTLAIRKLSVSTECDLSAEITNEQLISAVQLSVASGQFVKPQDAWAALCLVNDLKNSPPKEYINITNAQSDALRSSMCMTRQAAYQPYDLIEGNQIDSLIYLDNALNSFRHSTMDNKVGICLNPVEVAALAASIRAVMEWVGVDRDSSSIYPLPCAIAQQMNCSAAYMENYWISESDLTLIQRFVSTIRAQAEQRIMAQISALVNQITTAHGEQEDVASFELDSTQRELLMQAVKLYILFTSNVPQKQHNTLLEWLDYLMYSRPAYITARNLFFLQDLIRSSRLQLETQPSQWTIRSRLLVMRSDLKWLMDNESSQQALSTNMAVLRPREAVVALNLLNHMVGFTGQNSHECAILQSALTSSIMNNQPMNLWGVLSEELRQNMVEHLRRLVEAFVIHTDCMNNLLWTTEESASLKLAGDVAMKMLTPGESSSKCSALEKILQLIPGKVNVGDLNKIRRALHATAEGEDNAGNLKDIRDLHDAAKRIEDLLSMNKSSFERPEYILELAKNTCILSMFADELRIDKRDLDTMNGFQLTLLDCLISKQSPSTIDLSPFVNLFSKIHQSAMPPETKYSYHDQLQSDSDRGICISPEGTRSLCQQSATPSNSTSTSPDPESFHTLGKIGAIFSQLGEYCRSGELQPEQAKHLCSSVETLEKVARQLPPTMHAYTLLSADEQVTLEGLKKSAQAGSSFKLDNSAIEVLHGLGQRLTALAIQANQDLLRTGLEIWLTASVRGKLAFDNHQKQQLCAALCLARDTISNQRILASSDNTLDLVNKVIEQCSLAAGSSTGMEINGPHTLGPAVTEILGEAQRVHKQMSAAGSSLSMAFSSSSEWQASLEPEKEGTQETPRLQTELKIPPGNVDSGRISYQGVNKLSNPSANLGYFQPEGTQSPVSLGQRYVAGYPASTRNITQEPARQSVGVNIDELKGSIFKSLVTEKRAHPESWNTNIGTRLSSACSRVESLLSVIPLSESDQSSEGDSRNSDRAEELNRLRREVLRLKEQLSYVVGQLESAERSSRSQALLTSSLRELMEQQRQFTFQLMSERSSLVSPGTVKPLENKPLQREPNPERHGRIYFSSDCLRENLLSSVTPTQRSNTTLYKPLETVTVDLSATLENVHRFSSLDRLHELIEIRRAVVAGSREELCNLGVYSSMPLKPVRSKNCIEDAASTHQTHSESCPPDAGEKRLTARTLHSLLEKQRSYTCHLVSRSTYEQDQSTRILEALEQRLANLENQIGPITEKVTHEFV
ncbi:unnamed protein product [Calicophoron daubneyi]|uniref:Uncharacterized protein n=1 Tax=Calicophoron daubneyi TaxID=300641 RepID=A0AAV2TX02_CALDB